MPYDTSFEIPEEPPIRPDANPGMDHVTHETDSGHQITIYDLALAIQGMMLNSMISEGVSPNYNSPEEVMAILQDELDRYGDDWHEEYLARCYDVSITDAAEVESVPDATKKQDTLYEAALVHAGEMFWGFVSRHATRREVRQMRETEREKYFEGGPLSDGEVIRRVPEPLTPVGRGVMFIPEFPGRPDWLSDEAAYRANRLIYDLEGFDPYLPHEYNAREGR